MYAWRPRARESFASTCRISGFRIVRARPCSSRRMEPNRANRTRIASAPEDAVRDGCLELLVGVDGGGEPGSHLRLTPGALVDIEGPLGRFTFPEAPQERRFLFVAGGTGIAPLRAMFRHALARGNRTSACSTAPAPLTTSLTRRELRELAAEGRLELLMTVTRDADGEWSGTRGRIRPGAARTARCTTRPRCASFAARGRSSTTCPGCSPSSASRHDGS